VATTLAAPGPSSASSTAIRAAAGSVRRPPGSASPLLGWPLLIAAAAAGTIVVGFSYRLSAEAQAPDLYYVVFWVGMLVAILPVTARVVASDTAPADRLWAILLFAFVTAVPKGLRNFADPRYHDEYAHWREAVDVALSGRLFQPNTTIPIVASYPGTSALTVAAHWFSGLSLWSAGTVLVFAVHVLGLYAVYLLGDALLSSSRAGGIAAVVYGINPSAIYFDTQYAYESLAVNFFLCTLALTALAGQTVSARYRRAFLGAAVASAGGCVVTHHISTMFLIIALTTAAVAATIAELVDRRRASPRLETKSSALRVWWIALGCTVCLAVAWVTVFARPTLDYLSPYFGDSVHQLESMTHKNGGGSRHLLAANVEPRWEQLLSAAAPAVIMAAAVAALIIVRRQRVRLDPPLWGLMVFGLGYFLSIPFILAPSGAEGARRSWGFTYAGVALIVTLVAMHWPSNRPRWLGRNSRLPLLLTLFVTVLIGNVGAGLNDPYRFPGRFHWGTDTNSASDEARTVARELEAKAGRVRVVSDTYTALQLAAYGGLDVAAPSTGFPAWNLTQTAADPSPELAGMLVWSSYDYLVVDIRMGQQAPFNGDNFGRDDPLLGQATPMSYLTRLDSVPWASRVISTEHLRVYRLNLHDIAARTRQAP